MTKNIRLLIFGLIFAFGNLAGLAFPAHMPGINGPPDFTFVPGNPKLSGYFIIIEQTSRMCLTVAGGSKDPDACVIATYRSNKPEQVWKIEVGKHGYIFTVVHSGMCLSVSNGPGQNADGQPLIQTRRDLDNPTQMWLTGGPKAAFISAQSGKLLTLKNDNKSVVQLAPSDFGAQKWNLEQIQWPPPPVISTPSTATGAPPPHRPPPPPPPEPKSFISGYTDHTFVNGGHGTRYFSCVVQNSHPSRSIRCTVQFNFNNALGTR